MLAKTKNRLAEYDQKRDFDKTREPPGKLEKRSKYRFVIQKHEASHLHYDFRLEIGGTLRSWAVPKGPPTEHAEKRLAMEVEDHPVSYIDFEGTIPKGQYGGGTVMVWDFGTFTPLTETPEKDLEGGKLHFELHGDKLEGEWYLVRTKRGGSKNQWLLIRGGDTMKPISKKQDDTSAQTGRSMKEIEATRVSWEGGKKVAAKEPAAKRAAVKATAKKKTATTATIVKKTAATKAAAKQSTKAASVEIEVPAKPTKTTGKGGTLDVRGTPVHVSNLDKVLYPKAGFTKAQVIQYYIDVSAALLPTLQDRPVTLKRYPDGVDKFFFYEKRAPSHRPDWIQTVFAESKGGGIDYVLLNDLPSLVWAANLADLELHTFLHRGKHQDRPDSIVFDLDPGAPAAMLECCRVALWLQTLFDGLGLQSFVKTSGSKGLQVGIPLHTATTYEDTKPFAHSVALLLEREHPELVVSQMKKSLRDGKILVDWSQNDEHKTTVNVYSLRAKERPSVSTPITWAEVESAVQTKDASTLDFGPTEVLERLRELGDLWAPMHTLKQKLPSLAKKQRARPLDRDPSSK